MSPSATVFEGCVRVAAGDAHAEIIGEGSDLSVRFDSSKHARAFARGGRHAARLIGLLPPGTRVRVEIGGREVARLGSDAAGRWTPSGLIARLSGLPIVGVRPAWWIGRRG